MIKPTHDYICYVYIIFSFWMHFDDYFQPIEVTDGQITKICVLIGSWMPFKSMI